MFLKPFRVKTKTAIKGSERKRIRAEIVKEFPSISEEQLHELVPNKEEILVMKVALHSEETAVVYCCHKNPIFFEIHGVTYPTVYSMWKCPDALPAITTWPQVFDKINRGADLMLPGVIVKGEITPQNLGKLERDQPCSVRLLGNKSPVAVGVTARSSMEMYEANMRGKGVIIYHAYKDFLWAHGDKSHPPMVEDTEMLQYVNPDHGDAYVTGSHQSADTSDETSQQATVLDQQNDTNNDLDHASDSEDRSRSPTEDLSAQLGASSLHGGDSRVGAEANSCDNEHTEEEEDTRSPHERMDDLLVFCFKCAMKAKMKKKELPLLTSTFYKTCMQPFCPPDQNLDIKKSSYKKLGKFLQSMQREGYIKVKELSKGVESIVAYDKDHLELRGLKVPEVTIEKAPETNEESSFTPPQIVELFTFTAAFLPFLQELGINRRKGDAVTGSEIRQYMTDYVKNKELQHKGKVTLDPILADLVLTKAENQDTMRWENVMSRVQDKLTPAYQYTLPGQPPVVKKGRIDPVKLLVEQRSGKKKITVVKNLEAFGIDCQKFAHQVQTGIACSAAVKPIEGKVTHDVVIQGNQVNFIANLLLEKYQLPRRYLHGLDLAPKSGNKKR